MTSHKLHSILIALLSVTVSATSIYDNFDDRHQLRRPIRASISDKLDASSDDRSDDGYRVGYRFGEEFFLPAASKSVPARHKTKADGCERVVKDTMICMVCKDVKTSAKYEQCSYVGNPISTEPASSRSTPAWKKQVSYSPQSSSDYAESSTNPRSSYDNSDPSRFYRNPNKDQKSSYSPSKPDGPPTYGFFKPDSDKNDNSKNPYQGDYESHETSKPEASHYNDDYSPTPYSYFDGSKEDSESSEDPAESSDCREIVKNSQTCKICKDPKTGKDFERCTSSYKPDDKTYAYGKTENYGYPESDDISDDEKDYKTFENDSESAEDPAETSDCRQIKKKNQICTLCKNPTTGQDSESCSSSYRPDDKTYAFGTSEIYGGPSSLKNDDEFYNNDDEKVADSTYNSPSKDYFPGYSKNDKNVDKYRGEKPKKYQRSNYDAEHPETQNYRTGSKKEYESAPVGTSKVKKNVDKKGCHKIQKDSMTCTVCKDPETGGNSEKCSYAYEPDDKVYKFTKSKSFGYPDEEKDGGSNDSLRQSESKVVIDAVKNHPCKQVQKGSMLCTICKDPKNGGNSEECSYNTKPTGKLLTYSSSKSVDNPDDEEQYEDEKTDDNEEQPVSESKRDVAVLQSKDCRKIRKASMNCDVCKDRKTGAKSQSCSYSSNPKGNRSSYSKSKTSENRKPSRDDKTRIDELSPESSETKIKNITKSPCEKVEKNSMICTICRDHATGENSERCTYSYVPNKNRFTNSDVSGKPPNYTEPEISEEIVTPHHESRRLSRTLNDGWDTKINRYTPKTNRSGN